MKKIILFIISVFFMTGSFAQVDLEEEEHYPLTEEEIFYDGDQLNPEAFPMEEEQAQEYQDQVPVEETPLLEDPQWEQQLEENSEFYEE